MLNCFCNVLISIIIIIVKLKKITQIKIDTKHRNLVRFWSEWGQNLVRIWSEWGRNMVGIWSEWGRNEVGMGSEWGQNEVGIWSEYGRKWSKNTSFFNSDSAQNDSEKLGMAKNLSLNFFYFFTRNEVGIWSDSYHSARIHSECVGEGKVLLVAVEAEPFFHHVSLFIHVQCIHIHCVWIPSLDVPSSLWFLSSFF